MVSKKSYVVICGAGMAGCGAGERLATQITGDAAPTYVAEFSIARYEHPAYQRLLENWPDQGQL